MVFSGMYHRRVACVWDVPLLKEPQRLVLAAVLYGIGLFGDSYYGLAERVPAVMELYEAGFSVFSYTRNGIFLLRCFCCLAPGQERAG